MAVDPVLALLERFGFRQGETCFAEGTGRWLLRVDAARIMLSSRLLASLRGWSQHDLGTDSTGRRVIRLDPPEQEKNPLKR